MKSDAQKVMKIAEKTLYKIIRANREERKKSKKKKIKDLNELH